MMWHETEWMEAKQEWWYNLVAQAVIASGRRRRDRSCVQSDGIVQCVVGGGEGLEKTLLIDDNKYGSNLKDVMLSS